MTFGQIYPTALAVAFRLDYGPKWKLGQSPKRTKLGRIQFPYGGGNEQGEWCVRCKFPTANWARLYDETGKLFCSMSL